MTRFSEIGGGRFDPDYHRTEYIKLYNNLENGFYTPKKLKNAITKIYTGNGMYEYTDKGITYLNVNNIRKYEVSFESTNFLKDNRDFENKIYKNTIITGRVGTIGNFAKYEEDFCSLISDNVFALVLNENLINPNFANCFLNSILCYRQLKRNSRGAVQEVISTSVLNNIVIPLPPLTKQTEIANHIQTIRDNANKLKINATQILQQAKEEVEAIILGK